MQYIIYAISRNGVAWKDRPRVAREFCVVQYCTEPWELFNSGRLPFRWPIALAWPERMEGQVDCARLQSRRDKRIAEGHLAGWGQVEEPPTVSTN